jgi:hypothetical protein
MNVSWFLPILAVFSTIAFNVLGAFSTMIILLTEVISGFVVGPVSALAILVSTMVK